MVGSEWPPKKATTEPTIFFFLLPNCPSERKKTHRTNRRVFRGERGIRTPDTLLAYTRFPGVPLQPLEHHSFADKLCKNTTIIFFAQRFLPIFRQRGCDGCILSFYEAGKAGGHRELEIHLLSGDWMHKS